EKVAWPAFDVVVELQPGDPLSWVVVTKVPQAVDAVLSGQQYTAQRRRRAAKDADY
ncbi:unnamed protein product, partial [Heterosigma akashiwo]